MSSDYRTPVVEYHGQTPCIEPHILGRLLDKLKPVRAKMRDERNTRQAAWAGMDALAEAMEAAK